MKHPIAAMWLVVALAFGLAWQMDRQEAAMLHEVGRCSPCVEVDYYEWLFVR